MPAWVCLLRWLNLRKQRKLPMAALRDSLAAAGLTGVRTYMQSGNVINESPLRMHAHVSQAMSAHCGTPNSDQLPG